MSLPDIQIDPRNEQELLSEVAEYVFAKSNGAMGNFSPGNPLLFLLEGQVYAGAELLWYINQLPTKLLSQWLGYWGLSESDGSQATGTLLVQLVGALPSDITIPTGVLFGGKDLIFESTASVTILAGNISGSIPIRCLEVGSNGNVLAYQIDQIVSPTPFVKSATNPTQLVGGSDAVKGVAAIQSFVSNFQNQSCISAADIKRFSKNYLGSDQFVVRVVTNINPQTNLSSAGTVAVLVGSRDIDAVVPISVLSGLDEYLQENSPVTVGIWVSNIDTLPLVIRVNARYDEADDPQLVANDIVDRINRQLSDDEKSVNMSAQDLALICHDSGAEYTSGSINNQQSVGVQSVRQMMKLKYAEIRLSTKTNREYRNGNDSRLLFGGNDLSQLFLFGQGDED